MTMTFSLHSPKAQAKGQHIAKRSVLRSFYGKPERHDELVELTAEQRPDMAMNFVERPSARFVGTFAFGKRSLYQAIIGPGGQGATGMVNLIATYAIVHEPTGTAYVGSTKRFFKRWAAHLNQLRSNKHTNVPLQDAFNRDGEDAFTFRLIGHYDTTVGLMEREVEASMQFDSLFNIRIGNVFVDGWHQHVNWGKNYKPKSKRNPNSVSRWFDHLGVSKNATRH